jgi:predicted  nucleic acid-binding Zn-ribbon protein
MSKMQAAAEDIKKLGQYLSGLIEFAGELEKMGSLQQAAKEAEKRIADVKAKEDQANDDLAHAELALDKAQKKSQEIIDLGNHEAGLAIVRARSQAEKLVLEADNKSKEICALALEKKVSLELQVQNLQEKKALLQVEVQDVLSVLNPLKAELAALKEKLGA